MSVIVQKKAHYAVKNCQGMPAQVKGIDMQGRIVEMVWNTFNYLDSQGDVLMPGCAKRSIKGNGPKSMASAKIKAALFHDLTRLPGKPIEIEERNDNGLQYIYAAVLMNDTQEGNDTLKNYEAEIYDNHSIGLNYLQTEFVDRQSKKWDGIVAQLINPEAAEERACLWIVKEIALWEGSTVAFGANELTPCLGIKDGTPQEKKDQLFSRLDIITQSLRKGTQSDDMLHTLDLQVRQIKQLIDELDLEDSGTILDRKRDEARIDKPKALFTSSDVQAFLGSR
jgi:hypothetical protein